jgi:flagellar protein FlgJ
MSVKIDPSPNPLAPRERVAPPANANDFRQFAALRRGAEANDPKVLREAARQFESLFTKMVLDSMRKASFGDSLFGSDEGDQYQGMMDDQMAVQLSQGKGLGLADMLIRQLSHGAVNGSAAPAADAAPAASNKVSDAQRQKFIDDILPQASAAARELGVDPRAVIAQAALETGWGTSQPADATGASHNLFGIKAGASWRGASVTSDTTEYVAGAPRTEPGSFRAYGNVAESANDYVRLLRDNSRYAAALDTGANVRAFADGLQRGGYATDPGYADKLVAIAEQVVERLPIAANAAPNVNQFKSADESPIPTQEPSRILSNG